MDKIPLIWCAMIRNRLNDRVPMYIKNDDHDLRFKDYDEVVEFIKPILEYGEREEERIAKAFELRLEEEKKENKKKVRAIEKEQRKNLLVSKRVREKCELGLCTSIPDKVSMQ